jgi:uncharacterized membrane protein YdfJ with MMPL/SSD domain
VAAQADADQADQKAVNLAQDLSIVFIVVLLLVVFRSLLAPLLTLAPAVLVTQLAGPVIAEATKADLQVSSLTQILLLILTLGAGTDYGLFLVFRVREELRAGRAPHDAVTQALARVGESITFSAATVIAALLTLLLATFGLYSHLGGQRAARRHFPAATSNPTTVVLRFRQSAWTDPAPAAEAEERLAALPQFTSLNGPVRCRWGHLHPRPADGAPRRARPPRRAVPLPRAGVPAATWAAYRAESRFISPDGRTVLFNAALTAGDPGSTAAIRQVPALRAAVAAVARATGASAYGVTGVAPAGYDVGQASDADLLHIIPVAIIVIGLLLALGEDYNILVMTRIREEADRIPLRQAVKAALEHTGSTVTSAGLILSGTFGVFALVIGKLPGGGGYTSVLASLAIGILMDAFLVRTLLVPATVALLGRWNWWPSAHRTPAQVAPSPEMAHCG